MLRDAKLIAEAIDKHVGHAHHGAKNGGSAYGNNLVTAARTPGRATAGVVIKIADHQS
jgi:hypothetical protein